MTDKDWKEEVQSALAGAGLPWLVTAAWVGRGEAGCEAELVDMRTGRERTIRLSHQQFSTEAERRAEIVRQTQALKG